MIQVNELTEALERLLENEFSYKAKDFIFKFRKPIGAIQAVEDPLEPQFDETGRSYVEYLGKFDQWVNRETKTYNSLFSFCHQVEINLNLIIIGLKMSAVAKVRVTKPGTGVFKITHIDYPEHESDIRYFYSMKDRHVVMYPLQFCKLLGLVDVTCIVDSGGSTGQAGAIRYALSMCLRSFVEEETSIEMKVAGLLTQDVRVHERKKPGQPGAREKFTWKKR